MVSAVQKEGQINANLLGAFRDISYHRRQGVLHIVSKKQKFKIMFFDGIIVSVEKVDQLPAKQISKRLYSSKVLIDDLYNKLFEATYSVQQLYSFLVSKRYVTHEQFMSTKSIYEINLLHSISTLRDIEIEFEREVVDLDSYLSLDLYPCQVLLDFLEYPSVDKEIKEQFFGVARNDLRLLVKDNPNLCLSKNEEEILKIAEDCENLARLFNLSPLSDFHTKVSVLDLIKKELLVVRRPEEGGVDELISLELPLENENDSEDAIDAKELEETKAVGKRSAQRERRATTSSLSVLYDNFEKRELNKVLVVLVVIIYLLSLSYCGPEMISKWLSAMVNFV